MLESLKKIFNKSQENSQEPNSKNELKLLCGLMIEATQTDGKIDQNEIDTISGTLIKTFHEVPSEVELILQNCLKEINEPKSLHTFTSRLNKIFSDEKNLKYVF